MPGIVELRVPDTNEPPDFGIPWLERWIIKGFSWPELANQVTWLSGQGGTIQDYLRRLARNADDSDLIHQGTVVNCGPHGYYHVLFVPEEWATSGIVEIAPDELRLRKQQHWEKLFAEGGIRETFRGTITGVQLPPNIEQRLVTATAASFEWTKFEYPLRQIPRRGDRSFTFCQFNEQINFYGRANPEGGECTVHFTWCEFAKPLIVEKVSALDLLDINGSLLREKIEISDSSLAVVRLDYCDAKSLSITDSTASGPISIGETTFEWIEWINGTFNAHVLFVASEIRKSLYLLACDFRSRLTLADMTWPTVAARCASASGSKFDGIVEIAGGEPPPVQLFQEAEFRSKVSLSSYSDRAKRESFKKELAASEGRMDTSFDRQKHAQEVESGCRTLRKVAEAAGDVQSEQLWHRAELIARRARGDSDASETGFSRLYEMLADYGLSISRPFVVLAISTLLFALLYAWIGGGAWFGEFDPNSIEEGLGYSLNRTIPIGVFGEEHNAWRDQLLGGSGEIRDIAVRIIATSQTLFSAILIYLGVMAIRRKFRIS